MKVTQDVTAQHSNLTASSGCRTHAATSIVIHTQVKIAILELFFSVKKLQGQELRTHQAIQLSMEKWGSLMLLADFTNCRSRQLAPGQKRREISDHIVTHHIRICNTASNTNPPLACRHASFIPNIFRAQVFFSTEPVVVYTP